MARTLKYAPLTRLLKSRSGQTVSIAFSTIDRAVDGLPYSARTYPAWWYGTAAGARTHTQKRAWEEAGFTVSTVNLSDERVVFTRL